MPPLPPPPPPPPPPPSPPASPLCASPRHSAIFRPLSLHAYDALAPPTAHLFDPRMLSDPVLAAAAASPPPQAQAQAQLPPPISSLTLPPPRSDATHVDRHVAHLVPPLSPADDLGDDDSFSPEIVSGYPFNTPPPPHAALSPHDYDETHERDASPPSSSSQLLPASPPHDNLAAASSSKSIFTLHKSALLSPPPSLPPSPYRVSPPRCDLGDDDTYYPDAYDVPAPRHTSALHYMPSSPSSRHGRRVRDHDHRTDAIFDDLDDIGDWVASAASGTGKHPAAHLTKRLVSAVNSVSMPSVNRAAASATAALSTHQRQEDRRRNNHAADKLDRATVEQVLDPRTRMILFRLLSRNRLRTLDGCVSTGKEANVYYATAAAAPDSMPDVHGCYAPNEALMPCDTAPDAAVAVKVFKTSILQFKDRERYVAGEFRFRRAGYQRGSNRKMVQQWAEKEFRNQMRLQEAGIPAPVPLLLKPPVLIMSFFGKDGWPAPRLKDASLSRSRLTSAYFCVCLIMRRMFRVAHLVHGDLSEYNMLYWNGQVIIIDVSQSVEDDHPMALEFLRRDCANVNDFFRRSGVATVLGVRELFDFVTGEHIGDEVDEQEKALSVILEVAAIRDVATTQDKMRDDDVFMRAYVPRTLHDIELQEKQFRKPPQQEDMDSSLYSKLTGLSAAQKRERSDVGASSGVPSHVVDEMRTPPEAVAPRMSDEIDDDSAAMDTPNLEVPCVEPAAFRKLPSEERHRMRTGSPCTSNSSSRHIIDEAELARSAIAECMLDREAAMPGSTDIGGHRFLDSSAPVDDTFDVNDDSESSSSEGWVRPTDDAEKLTDPYMGLSKKEWKKRVKAEQRERREQKVPKHVKKRKETLAKRRRGTK